MVAGCELALLLLLLLAAGLLLVVELLTALDDVALSAPSVCGWLEEDAVLLEASGLLEEAAGLLLEAGAALLLDESVLLSLAFMLDTNELWAAGDFGVLLGFTVLLIQL
ncbi:hypothetical protein FC75_GL001492 [Lacticaseibacillus camelliae DSM 22697 = JCM 13995]|uniref:Uncharacterized protein n=1 Tax=Lacticaseibacillus camelliae DSM 22697 = JCM 13995 TaxID=1423730 RepID=A0A0R2FEB3_9LACO|nr:hypothetical protein FC75_GL001492 [Lacticaseibacillus camelliae DSM 22697 = JCM 13995]